MIFHQPHNSQSNYNYNAVHYTQEIWQTHFHKNLELIYVLQGAVRCTVGRYCDRLTAGDFGLCLPCLPHSYIPEPDSKYWVLVFSEDFVRYFISRIGSTTGQGFRFRCDAQTEEYIVNKLVNGSSYTVYDLKSCLYGICGAYIQAIRQIPREDAEGQMMNRIIRFVQDHHKEDLTLLQTAKALGYDYHYLSRCFHGIFNMHFSDFVNSYRLETALALLEDSSEQVATVALESGFQSVRTFNDFFKEKLGVSPSAYRKALRHSAD